MRLIFLSLVMMCNLVLVAQAQTLTTSNVQIEWKVENRFRLFRNAADFAAHEAAWRQYKIHVDGLAISPEEKEALVATTSVIGTEHVLNDRYIPFTRHLRSKYDWRGWAARTVGELCWDAEKRAPSACGGIEAYVNPKVHAVQLWLKPLQSGLLVAEYNCEWRLGGADAPAVVAPCDEPVSMLVPYPSGATVSVNIEGEGAISRDIAVKDLLVVGMGDSFASGEGNPDVPVAMTSENRHRNIYPRRARNDVSGNAQWMDETCHRSLYGHQLRAALQIAVENAQTAVTFLGYACSGAEVAEGILGPQSYMDYVSRGGEDGGTATINAVSGSAKDTQIRWLLRDLCKVKPQQEGEYWTCPDQQYRRTVDYVFLSIGGNDIGFSNLVTWATLRDSTSSKLAKFFGASISAKTFAKNMVDELPSAYAKLARALEQAVPLQSEGLAFNASRVVLTAYPDILEDENGKVCPAGAEGDSEDYYAANQSLDYWSKFLAVTPRRLNAAHDQLEKLHRRMGDLAEDHGWQFAGRAYEDRPFRGHGFCARNQKAASDPAEQMILPCVGKAERASQSCDFNLSGREKSWRPFDPGTENYPYALRQRWVRTFNDAYMIINQKVTTRDGKIDERASEAVFAETTGAMHPSAEGHAAMADAILLDLRAKLAADITQP